MKLRLGLQLDPGVKLARVSPVKCQVPGAAVYEIGESDLLIAIEAWSVRASAALALLEVHEPQSESACNLQVPSLLSEITPTSMRKG